VERFYRNSGFPPKGASKLLPASAPL